MLTRLVLGVAMSAIAQGAFAQTYGAILGPEAVDRIVREETSRFVEQFHAMTTPQTILVDEDFFPAVSGRVLETQAPNTETADRSLRIGFGSFLSDLTAFLLATTGKATVRADEVSRYIEAARKVGRCGRIPCPMGCPQGCDTACNPCPR